jgi:alpha-glucosidase
MRVLAVAALVAALGPVRGVGAAAAEQWYTVSSPDEAIQVRIDTVGRLRYSVMFGGRAVIEWSDLGFVFRDEPDLQMGLEVVRTLTASHDEVWTPVVKCKHARVRDCFNELTLVAQERTGLRRRVDVLFRAYDDGVAFRYRLYRSEVIGVRHVTGELTAFAIPDGEEPRVWVAEYPGGGGYASSQEGEFMERSTDYLTESTVAGLPLLMRYSDSCWVAVTEAHIDNYPAFYIGGAEGRRNLLRVKLAPLPGEGVEGGVKVRCADDVVTPWRVVMIGRSPGALIESELVRNLNPPCAIDDPSWIEPGMSAWDHWWSGEVRMEMPVIREYIDFAAEMGWPFMLVDWQWYGPFNRPEADICRPAPQVDMPGLLSYAKSKGVRIWLWLYSSDVNRNDAYKEAFRLYREWGVAGVKIDFMDRDDQEMVNWYREIVRCAAENRLLVDFHGAYKPDGIIRTWPNVLTREGVMGNEYYKFGDRVSPEHNVKLAFTRMLAGEMDYTPGGFNNVTAEAFRPQSPTLVANTRAAELAKFVVYESPFTVMCEHPRFVLGQPGADFLRVVPTVWDDVRFLGGEPDRYVAVARQSGDEWFVGVLNNSTAREVDLSFDFLPEGVYSLEAWEDARGAGRDPRLLRKTSHRFRAGKTVKVKAAKAGGYVARIRPVGTR